MIGQLTGQILSCSPGEILLDVNGVGYALHIPLSSFYALSSDAGERVSLHVHTHVREDALQLFGFASLEERSTFELLIGISGVGPRMALAILSGIGVEELAHAVASQDRARLQKIPGVGQKTAGRLLLELKGRIQPPADRPRDDSALPAQAPEGSDAVSALVNLGYTREVARRAVERARDAEGSGATLERLLRAALAGLVR